MSGRRSFTTRPSAESTRVSTRRRLSTGDALQAVRPLEDVDSTLRDLAFALALISLGGIALAVWLGMIVARTALRPVKQLTAAAEHVARTRDLSRRIRADGTDELSRLGASFNTMLEALADAERSQRQLVADASHELRTPLTSLRTNIEVLAPGCCRPEERDRLLGDLVAPARRADGARGRPGRPGARRRARGRSRGRAPRHAGRRTPSSAPDGTPPTRSSSRSWSRAWWRGAEPPRSRRHEPARQRRQVESGGRSDRGAGARRRGERARSRPGHRGRGHAVRVRPLLPCAARRAGLPGSGLGLAIVRQVAESHGGTVTAERANGGGARMSIKLPVLHLRTCGSRIIADTHMAAGGRTRLPDALRGADRRKRPGRARRRHHERRGAGRDRGDRPAGACRDGQHGRLGPARAATRDGRDRGRRAPGWPSCTTPARPRAAWSGCGAGFPTADAVVFGHSHMPLHERDGGFQIFNPGQSRPRGAGRPRTRWASRTRRTGASSSSW